MHCALKTAVSSALALALAAPASAQVYGQPYGAPSPAPYGQQPYGPSYGGPYNQPAPGGYGAPQTGYGAPYGGYGAPQTGYGAPYGGYGAPPGSYPAPQPSYGTPPNAYPVPAYGAPAAGAYGANTAYVAPVKCDNTGAIAGGLIGALGGGVLGSNVASHGNKTEGTVLGAVVGGGLGALVGHAHDNHKCDQRGVYYSYADTVPYQADTSVAADPRAGEYASRGCRMAPASVNGQEARYVRVCPDGDGRYRIAS